jgi:hypothetical protein
MSKIGFVVTSDQVKQVGHSDRIYKSNMKSGTLATYYAVHIHALKCGAEYTYSSTMLQHGTVRVQRANGMISV